MRRTVSGSFERSGWLTIFTAVTKSASLIFGLSAISLRQIAAIDCRVICVTGGTGAFCSSLP